MPSSGQRHQSEYTQSGSRRPAALHSLLTDDTVFERVLSRSAARRVTCVNLAGVGASAPVPLASVADHADHVAAVMDALNLRRATDLSQFQRLRRVAGRDPPRRASNLMVADVIGVSGRRRRRSGDGGEGAQAACRRCSTPPSATCFRRINRWRLRSSPIERAPRQGRSRYFARALASGSRSTCARYFCDDPQPHAGTARST